MDEATPEQILALDEGLQTFDLTGKNIQHYRKVAHDKAEIIQLVRLSEQAIETEPDASPDAPERLDSQEPVRFEIRGDKAPVQDAASPAVPVTNRQGKLPGNQRNSATQTK